MTTTTAKRIHGGSPDEQIRASLDEYRQHIEDQDLPADLLDLLAATCDGLAVEQYVRLGEPWRTTTIADFAFAVEVAAGPALGKLFG